MKQENVRPVRLRGMSIVSITLLIGSAAGSMGDGIAFEPSEGATLSKTFVSDAAIELDDLTVLVNGQDVAAMFGALEAMVEASRTITVIDEYGALGDDGPDALTRTFDAISGEISASYSAAGESDTTDSDLDSELEGSTVAFSRSDEGYDVVFVGDGGDEELLEGLVEDMDLRFLLPSESVGEGDSWEVPLRGFGALLTPGGRLHLGAETEDAPATPASIDEAFDELLEGTCTCTYTGTRDVDGTAMAEIELEIVVSSAVDLLDFIDEAMQMAGPEASEFAPTFEFADLNIDLDAEGTMLWNTETGLIYSLDLSCDGEVGFDIGFAVEIPGESAAGEASIELSIALQTSITTE